MRYQLDIYTSYGQFYLYDKDSSGKTDSENFLTDDAFNERLAIEDGILGVLTECYGPVKGELNILSSPNSSYDLTCTTTSLRVVSLFDQEPYKYWTVPIAMLSWK